ncbi:MAG: hypothetical protein KDK00_14340, partial [Rhodobacteraceae bacterium]|nr:hypothetical protein [Paracoccaceae bacterium]
MRIRPALLLLLIAGLAACGGGNSRLGGEGGARTGRGFSSLVTTPRDETIQVAGRDVIIAAPKGFCIDHEVSQIGGDTAFVLLGSCQAVAGNGRGAAPPYKALLTASVSAATEGGKVADSLNGMDRFFRSDTGLTALSRDSNPANVEVLETFQQDDMFYLRANDTSAGIVPGAAPDYWRAYFDLPEQIVSVSVIGFNDDPLAPEKGLEIVREFAAMIRQRNSGAAAMAPPPDDTPLERVYEPAPETV